MLLSDSTKLAILQGIRFLILILLGMGGMWMLEWAFKWLFAFYRVLIN